MVLGDYDLDSDLDIFQVNFSNLPDRVWLNNGAGAFVDSGLRLGLDTSSHAAIGDIDADGDLDAIIATYDPTQPNRIWFNTTLPMTNPNDLDGDNDVDGDDIDAICLAIQEGSTNAIFDIDGNGIIESPDFSLYLDIIGTKLGDANLDGVVDVSDFNIWNLNKFTSNDPALPGKGWATGDFNCDGVTDVSDFNIWNINKFTSALRPGDSLPGDIMRGQEKTIDFGDGERADVAVVSTPGRTAVSSLVTGRIARRSLSDIQALESTFEEEWGHDLSVDALWKCNCRG